MTLKGSKWESQNKPMWCWILLVGAALLMLSSVAKAQSTFGSIVGTIQDSTGGVIPAAHVTLTNLGTSESQGIDTDSTGSYHFVNLAPGRYRIAIEKSGYNRKVMDNLQVLVQQAVRADAVLDVGAVTQTVEVTAQAALLQTEQSSLSQAVEGRTVQEMPLNGRNVLNLVSLVPGVVPQGSTSGSALGNQGNGATTNPNGWGNYQIGGGAANQSATYYDGAPLNVSYVNSTVLVPTQDAVQEFRVATNSVSPEFGRFAGGVINLASKSGTNSFHGGMYEYVRNTSLNASNYFATTIPAFHQNQYGASLAGPIRRDKTFFMGAWENFALRVGLPTVTTVPSADMKKGNFTAAGIPAIYDPLTTCGTSGNPACGVDGSGNPIYTRQQFQYNGQLNVIPPNRLDPTAIAMANLFGAPTLPNALLNNFQTNGTGGGDYTQINARVDHAISDAQHLFARYTHWSGSTIPNDLFHNKATANQEIYGTHNAVLGYTLTINPKTVADVHLSYLRFTFGFYPPSTGADLSVFGPAFGSLQNKVTFAQYPASQVTGMQTFNYVTVRNANNNEILSESITRILGRHNLKFGAESRKIEWGYGQTNYSSGQFAFTTAFTALNPQKPTGSGYAFASMMLGYPSSGQIQEILIAKQQMWYHGVYFQDTFQATPKLTLNLGVRWDFPGEFSEAHNSAAVFLPTQTDPLGQSVGLPLKGLASMVNSSAYSNRSIHPAKWDLFAPRVGFAYRFRNDAVIRGGYGISYLPNDVVFGNAPWDAAPNLATTIMDVSDDGGLTPSAVLSNPFPGGILQPSRSVTNATLESSILGSTIQLPVPDQAAPYAQQWNLALQQQLRGNMSFEIGYAGSKGTHLPLNSVVKGFPYFELNQIADSRLSQGNALLAKVANPFYGKVPSTAGVLTKPTIAQGQLLRPFPQFNGVNNVSQMEGGSTWNSLQVKVEKRLRQGSVVLGTYTWSKLLSNSDSVTTWLDNSGGIGSGTIQDWNNPRGEKSVASFDVPQRATISYVLDLPVGRGRRFGANMPAVADKIVGGWGLNGTTVFQSGFPLLLYAQPTTLSSTFGGGTPRPLVAAGCIKKATGSAFSRVNKWFNTSCFTQPGPFQFGNEPRADSGIRAQGVANWDVALTKSFAFTERYNLKFDSEFFNLANRVQFAAPNTQVGNPLFGKVTATRNQQRLIQLALRFSF